MDSTCLPVYSTPPDERRPTPLPLLVCGDQLDCLKHLTALDVGAQDATERRRARAIIIGIHIPDAEHPRKTLKSRLQNARDAINTHLRWHPMVRHVIYVVHPDPSSASPDKAVRLLSTTVRAHHAEIEMRHGRDICITGIVTSNHTSPEAFAKRVNNRIRTAPFEGSYATSWDEIVDRSIGAAATEELL